ncbi:hypothetical protein SBOR_0938 [Sclerotinia borealis F-4128]|uniref:Altered inheritance of mitochondria protein 41 n=1 Tax=Sclerotinia borealis (strain F-4128) TaxID=1432307 RepID=W9CVW3_SCLBF|nr:hypothetical protein SBOR_0938 [Sclerotinia borealis F-4128]
MFSRPAVKASRLYCRCYASVAKTSPPMLSKIRADIKTAMVNKDTTRRDILRSLLNDTLMTLKSNSPITTDVQMLALIRKSTTASRGARDQFKAAGREDLVGREEEQLKVLDEYASGVEMVGEDEIRNTVKELVNSMKDENEEIQMGNVLKRVFAPEVLGEKNVERGEVAKIVKEVMAEK